MLILKTQKEVRDVLDQSLAKSIGFIPTMGALHKGHISLVNKALRENEIVICSIFVNPTQFNDPKDLEKYPKPIEKDIELLKAAGCNILFAPEAAEMYEENEQWNHSFGELENIWEGAMRPNHFKGVGQIVYKLLDIVKPTKAYFGQKDFQQGLIVKKLVEDFKINTEIVICPIVREENGLAMSSRNVRLSEKERDASGKISKALLLAYENYKEKSASIKEIENQSLNKIKEIPEVTVEYLAIVDVNNLQPISERKPGQSVVMILAVRLSGTRLIDNMILEA